MTGRTPRYTAITCDPDHFIDEHFSLRQSIMGRSTELAIVITMYNENEELFCRTLYGVMKNISHLTGRKNSSTWGPGSWKKVRRCRCGMAENAH
jgi:chitin synthase